jgi:uncharacterized protein YyaL (SSP411 family)
MPNRLAQEKSVYLQQHGNNPVDWYPWGEAAFRKARDENKLLLISIGYSTCHWCHVMEVESFENPEVAGILNQHFVAIKVDREEHPDVDEFYMEAVQALTRRGGWPLNMFTTPDLKPFFGGTYFPREVFVDLLTNVNRVWQVDPAKVAEQADGVFVHLSQGNLFDVRGAVSPLADLRARRPAWDTKLIDTMLRDFDPVWGGFGPAPKFPRPHGIFALLRASRHSPDLAKKSAALVAVQQTLKGMGYGGLRDHLKGGFHRYSTDAEWLVPHFEKMLYDQALLVQAYAELYKVTREEFPRDIVAETLAFLETDFRLANGLFAAAQDADSEGIEGKYYVWTYDEAGEALDGEPAGTFERFARLHSVTLEGNWEGTNVLALRMDAPWKDWAAPEMRRLRERLLAVRNGRVPPITDTKAILAWNAWMATGLLQASFDMLDQPELSDRLLASARRTIEALLALLDGDELPRIVYGQGAEQIKKGQAYLEDYAAVIEAVQLLASRTNDGALWERAGRLTRFVDTSFRNAEGHLQSRRAGHHAELPMSKLEFHDGATPAAISVWAGCGLRQALVESDPALRDRILRDIAPLERVLAEHPYAVTHLLAELDLLDAFVLKVPPARFAEVLAEWARRADFPNQVLLMPGKGADFEACDFEQCFAKATLLKDVWRA